MEEDLTDEKYNNPGYMDFLAHYDKLEKLRQNKTLDSHLFIYYVTYCNKYIKTLDPYEYQILIQTMPSIENKIDTIKSLYEKVKSAIFETLNEISQKKQQTTSFH